MDNPLPPKEAQKLSIFAKIRLKFTLFKENLKQKHQKSEESKSFIGIVLEILTLGGLSYLAYLAIINPLWIIRLLGMGSGLWLVFYKVEPAISKILSQIKLVTIIK